MDSPPMFDISRLDIWKVMMSYHLKALRYKVHLAITKESYPNDSKHIEANAIALKALRASLHKDYLHVFSHYESAFAVWSILTSPELPKIIDKKRRSRRDESDERFFMVQGNNSLEVRSDTQLDASSSSYCNECMEAQAINNELAKNCENLISKYKLLKKDNFCLKEENKNFVRSPRGGVNR